MGHVKRTVFHTAVYGAGIVLNRGLAYLLVPLYTRGLTKTEFATWDVCAIVVLFLAPAFEFGMSAALLRFYHHDTSEQDRTRMVRTGITFVTIAVTVLTAIGIVFREPLARLAVQDASLGPLMVLCLLTAAFTVLSNQPLAILRAEERSMTYSLVNLFRSLLGPAAIVLLVVVFHWGVAGILLGELIGLVAMVILAFGIHRQYLRPQLDWDMLKPMLRYGLPLIPLGLASVVTLMSDRFFLVHAIGKENMAIFSLGFRIAMLMQIMSRAFQTAWPASALVLAKQPDGKPVFAQLFRLTMAMMFAVALGISAFAPELVRIFGGDAEYGPAYLIIPWIAFSYALYVAAYYITTNLVIVHRTTDQMLIFVFGALVKILLNWLLIGWFIKYFDALPMGVSGSLGAAIATTLAYIAELVLAWFVTQRHYPVPYELGKLAWLSAITLGIAVGCFLATGLPLAASLALRALLLAAFPLLLLATGIVTPAERGKVTGLIRKRLGR
ncbi:MAG: oligosaccharide flippase family protein [Candidatus Hydrogenedentes bacterium]|nr:oligosaccharide flippase family protein [Candidatus Hydrogenedentota bacterium]